MYPREPMIVDYSAIIQLFMGRAVGQFTHHRGQFELSILSNEMFQTAVVCWTSQVFPPNSTIGLQHKYLVLLDLEMKDFHVHVELPAKNFRETSF